MVNSCIPVICSAAVIFVGVVIINDKTNGRKKLKELKEATPNEAKGIVFGKKKGMFTKKVVYSPAENEGHCGIFSASGTGKTSAVCIPTLRSWTEGNTAFVIDIAGDIEANCPNIKNKLVYAPENPETTAYNIFAPIDELVDSSDKQEALEQLAYLLMPSIATTDNAKFYQDNGRKILTAALIAFYGDGIDFIAICERICSSSWKELFRTIDELSKKNPSYAVASMLISSFIGSLEQNTAGCKQACDDAIKLFATNSKIKASIHRPKKKDEITIQPSMIEHHSIFIIVDDPVLELYRPLLNVITSQMMQYISNRKINENSVHILLVLDEFASLGLDVTMILEALRKYRKRLCRVMILSQNLADLRLLYGNDATRAIMANIRFKALLGGLCEPESQKYFSDLIGYTNVTKRSKSTSRNQTTHTESESKQYIIEPSELDRQGNDTVILIHPENEGYMLLKKNYYFKG